MKFFGTISALLICVLSYAQSSYYTFNHRDDWLKENNNVTNKSFVKIQVVDEGIHRLNYSDLVNTGFNFTDVNEIQLFRRGIEQAIYIEDNGDGFGSSNDYIEFYARGNDGELDKELYYPRLEHPHSYYSLFTDTATYFLSSTVGETGKRTTNLNSGGGTAEAFNMEELLEVYTDIYSPGNHVGADIRVPYYNQGEGWFSTTKANGGAFNTTLAGVANPYNSSDPSYVPELEVLVVGSNNESQKVKIEISQDGTNYTQVGLQTFIGWSVSKINTPLLYSDISNSNNLYVRTSVVQPDSRVRLGYVKLKYPRNFDFTGQKTWGVELREKSISSTSSLNITSDESSGITYVVNQNGYHYRKVNNSNNFTIDVPHLQSKPFLFHADQSEVINVSPNQLSTTTLRLPDVNANYLIITPKDFQAGAEAYKTYRESVSGGQYDAQVYYVEDLIDIFSYGDFSSLAIRRFCDYTLSKDSAKKYMLLIGKGLSVSNNTAAYGTYRHNQGHPDCYLERNGVTPQVRNFNFLPPVGDPGSDIMYSAHIVDSLSWKPVIATGRVSAITNDEVIGYLDKVKEYEAAPDELWKKKILHLGGGNNSTEIGNFRSYLASWENIAEDEFFGGDVKTIIKSTTSLQYISVEDIVNQGVRLITFFGHSTTQQSDVDIGKVSDVSKGYNNTDGKYPIILLNGCQSGNFYNRSTGFGEDWVLTAGKGAVAFISSSTTAYANYLQSYTDKFYYTSFKDSNFAPSTIGDIVLQVNALYGSDMYPKSLGHRLNINILGDPALPAFSNALPDLEINNNSIFLDPVNEENVTAVSDTFNIGIIVQNFGRFNIEDSFYVSIQRTYNGITVDYKPKIFPAVAFKDTLYFGISSPNIQTYGLNNFNIKVDYHSQFGSQLINETNEMNNEVDFQQIIPLSGVYPLFPREFDIISLNEENEYNQPWVLVAQSTDMLVEERNYLFEIDTSRRFLDGGFKRSQVVEGVSLASWDATDAINEMLLEISNQSGTNPDSVVFYWRVKYNSLLPGEEDLWGNSSFTYIYQSPGGWCQAHYYQFKRDNFEYINLDSNTRKWEYESIKTNIRYATEGPEADQNGFLPKLLQDNVPPGYNYSTASWAERARGLLCNVYDEVDLTQKKNVLPSGAVGVRNNGRYYYFRMLKIDNTYMNNFVQFLDNVDDGDYVAIVTKDSTNYSDWPTIASAISTHLGGTVPPDGVGYAIMGKKGSTPLFEKYLYGSEPFDTIVKLESDLYYGIVNSTVIGPVTKWDKMYRNIKSENVEDEWDVDVYGVKVGQMQDSLLYSNTTIDGLDLSQIDAGEFPYIRLNLYNEDSTLRTPAQMKNWLITYKSEIPEGVIVANKDIDDYSPKEYYEGESRVYNFRFKNISKYAFQDSLVVHASIISAGSGSQTDKFKIQKPAPGEHVDFSYELTTRDLEGDYSLQITVNPSIEVEHYYHNNSFAVAFSVIADDIHPILDVTFDGTHIMDYDIVSPVTEIHVRMKDDNDNLLKSDREGIAYRVTMNDQEGQEIEMEETMFQFPTPESPNLEFKLKPKRPLPDGVYYLFVEVEDEKGNKSSGVIGSVDGSTVERGYRIHFEVINETTLTNFFPYPNPFSTSMRFAYTLTGSKQPDQLKIQIMTISGKIVREIDQYELGPLKIGKHLTDFVWDGTDEYGSKLGNGVYLYRVIANEENAGAMETIKFRDAGSYQTDGNGNKTGLSKADQLFKKGWGKLYIMR